MNPNTMNLNPIQAQLNSELDNLSSHLNSLKQDYPNLWELDPSFEKSLDQISSFKQRMSMLEFIDGRLSLRKTASAQS